MCLLKFHAYLQKGFWLLKGLSEVKVGSMVDCNSLFLKNIISRGMKAMQHNIFNLMHGSSFHCVFLARIALSFLPLPLFYPTSSCWWHWRWCINAMPLKINRSWNIFLNLKIKTKPPSQDTIVLFQDNAILPSTASSLLHPLVIIANYTYYLESGRASLPKLLCPNSEMSILEFSIYILCPLIAATHNQHKKYLKGV